MNNGIIIAIAMDDLKNTSDEDRQWIEYYGDRKWLGGNMDTQFYGFEFPAEAARFCSILDKIETITHYDEASGYACADGDEPSECPDGCQMVRVEGGSEIGWVVLD